MAQIIRFKNKTYRINPDNRKQIQISHNNGQMWSTRFFGQTTVGNLIELEVQGDNIIVFAEKGTFKTNENASALTRM